MNKYRFYHFLFFLEKALSKLNTLLSRKVESFMYKKIRKRLISYFKIAEHNLHEADEISGKIVWVLWWQGFDNAPEIVKACVNSVINNYDGKVVLVNKYNVKKYTDISDDIYDKLESGYITKTHFSDIVRFNILKNYGGLWIDSTILCTKKFEHSMFSTFYTSKGKEDSYPYFMKGKWTGFLIGGRKNDPTFQFMDEFFKVYWSENLHLINYFLIDYALMYAYERNIGGLSTYVDNEAINNNPKLFELSNLLNSIFDKENYNKLIKDTDFFKLTYKKKFKKGNGTFYDFLISCDNKINFKKLNRY
ncbi:capsular polysaccharide synthesis family protein [Apilactobacillus kunkeei]|uniref:capsular polysaccharide synthesis protein n=1 Tax=Apilactobacillus kunkeei TaxID=148814 RepID=UPI00110D0DD2|nr:capsular polysaccharide synthesis protein [Apilactobacillus kunkeei]TMT01278.1 capsular polysaccharide synthesis family protein [Apilactobacillus kunkeei]